MDLEQIKRGLRAEIKKRENEQYFTFQCNVRQMCKDVLAKLEEQESEIADKDAEIARLKDRGLDVKDAAHVLKAFKFYLCQLTHCAYDERTAQWIIDNWEQDYKRIEADK